MRGIFSRKCHTFYIRTVTLLEIDRRTVLDLINLLSIKRKNVQASYLQQTVL